MASHAFALMHGEVSTDLASCRKPGRSTPLLMRSWYSPKPPYSRPAVSCAIQCRIRSERPYSSCSRLDCSRCSFEAASRLVWTEIRQETRGLACRPLSQMCTMVVRAIRWQYLLEPIGHARFGPAFRTTTIWLCGQRSAPRSCVGGDSPISCCARQEGLSATATFATIIIERVLDA